MELGGRAAHVRHYSARVSRADDNRLNYLWMSLVVVAVGTATYFGFQVQRAGTKGFWLFAGAPLVAIAFAGALRAHRDGELQGWVRPVWGDPTRGVISAAALVLAAIAMVLTAGCESLRCTTCPDAQNQPPPQRQA